MNRPMLVENLLLLFNHLFALRRRLGAELAIAGGLPARQPAGQSAFEPAADALADLEPGDARQQTEPDGGDKQQHERRAGVAEPARYELANAYSEHAPGRKRKLDMYRVQAQRFQARAGKQ